MSKPKLASIIVNNYNYGRFLKDAIDSALGQTYLNSEVIVVDDGSTDHSREIIAEYGHRVIPVLKENGGQASAFNAGFKKSRGEVIVFLDADDMLLPKAVERALSYFCDPEVVKVHWPLWDVNEQGERTGAVRPIHVLPDGDLREAVIRDGPEVCLSPPTSGNAWARWFLERVFPVPEDVYGICADVYLMRLAPFFGPLKALPDPLSLRRVHGENHFLGISFGDRIKWHARLSENYYAVAREYCEEIGIQVDTEAWKNNAWEHHLRWWHSLALAVEELEVLIPPGETFVLVDQATLGAGVSRKLRPVPFPEHNGQYWGLPANDEVAIQELQRLRGTGASFVVFLWPAFWWLDYYTGLHQHLRSKFRCVLENERLVAFDLRSEL